MPNEICTLQVGRFANYIGSHFWNIQESSFCFEENEVADINHEILFREGHTIRGNLTFTPRLVTVDLKGSLGGLKAEGVLYQTKLKSSAVDKVWDGKLEIHKQEPFRKNQFQEDLDKIESQFMDKAGHSEKDVDCQEVVEDRQYHLEDQVKTWSDFLQPHFHPKSIVVSKSYTRDDIDKGFSSYATGSQVYHKELDEELQERIRYFVEECDNMQGFHLIGDSIYGYCGMYCEAVKHIEDEYSNKFMLAMPCANILPNCDIQQKNAHLLNTFLTFHHVLEAQNCLMCPLLMWSSWNNLGSSLTFTDVHMQDPLPYHESAVLALALDTASLIYRLKNSQLRLFDLPHFGSHRWTGFEFSPLLNPKTSFGTVIQPSFPAAAIDSRATVYRQGAASIPHQVEKYFDEPNRSLLQSVSQTWRPKTPFPNIIPTKNQVPSLLGSFVWSDGLRESLAELNVVIHKNKKRLYLENLKSSMELDEWEECIDVMKDKIGS